MTTLAIERKALLMAAAIVAIALTIGFGVVRGQSVTASSGTPTSKNGHKISQFDVISIKPTPSSDDRTLIQLPPDGASFHGAPVRMVLRTAFGIEDDCIVGVPSWVNTRRYDIEAKVAPEDASKLDKLKAGDLRSMLIALLTERFNLKYHHEARGGLPIYALVIAKDGPKLTKGEPNPLPGEVGVATGQNHLADPAKEHWKMLMLPGHIEADSVPVSALAYPLAQFLGRKVIDKTGLTGNYNFTLRWTPDNTFPPMGGPEGPSGPVLAENATDSASVSLFTAIQEQLGLKLESEKGSVDVLVIDHIDLPTPN